MAGVAAKGTSPASPAVTGEGWPENLVRPAPVRSCSIEEAERPAAEGLGAEGPAAAAAPVSAGGGSCARTVWIFWAQGWAGASPIARLCAASWERFNPDWHVRRIDLAALSAPATPSNPSWATVGLPAADANAARVGTACRLPANLTGWLAATYATLPHTHSPHYADLVRVELLLALGGLWVDATVLCVAPIRSWLAASVWSSTAGATDLGPTGGHADGASAPGFFALRFQRDHPEAYLHASQIYNFLLFARAPGHLVLRAMRANLRDYWRTSHAISPSNINDPDYFVWQQIFGCLVTNSPSFARAYDAMPSLPGDEHAPHVFTLRRRGSETQHCLLAPIHAAEQQVPQPAIGTRTLCDLLCGY